MTTQNITLGAQFGHFTDLLLAVSTMVVYRFIIDGTVNFNCFPSLHCRKVSRLHCCPRKIYEKILTKSSAASSLVSDTVVVYTIFYVSIETAVNLFTPLFASSAPVVTF